MMEFYGLLQLQNIIEFLQTFVYLFEDPENSMLRPVKYRLCQHMVLQPDCVYSRRPPASRLATSDSVGTPANASSTSRVMCPTSDDLKYRFVRVSIDCIDLYLVESGTALNVQVCVCYYDKWNYTASGKKHPGHTFDCNLKKDYQILIIFDTNISDTTGDQMTVQVSTTLIVCFCTTWETKLRKYCICILFCFLGFSQVLQKQTFGEVGTRTVI